MTTLATHVRTIFAGLQAAIAPIAARERARITLLLQIWTHLVRPTLIFEQLLADWRAGILPEQQTPAPSPTNACPAAAPGCPASATNTAATRANSDTSSPPPNAPNSAPKSPAPPESSAPAPNPSASKCPATPAPKPSCTPDPPPNPWLLPPEIGVTTDRPPRRPPNFSKAR